jgi:hypothetical protein
MSIHQQVHWLHGRCSSHPSVRLCVSLILVHPSLRHGSDPLKADEQMLFIRDLWRRRLSGVQRNVEVRASTRPKSSVA